MNESHSWKSWFWEKFYTKVLPENVHLNLFKCSTQVKIIFSCIYFCPDQFVKTSKSNEVCLVFAISALVVYFL